MMKSVLTFAALLLASLSIPLLADSGWMRALLGNATVIEQVAGQDVEIVAQGPRQTSLDKPLDEALGGYEMTGFARFEIEALILSRRNYRHGAFSDFSPVDLALGWGGPMSNRTFCRGG